MNSIFASLGLRRLRSSSATTTRHVDTHHAFSRPRPVRPDRKAGSRCPRVPTDLRRWRGAASDVPMLPKRAHLAMPPSWKHIGRDDIESRVLPRRKGSSPGSTMSRAPSGHRLRSRRVWRNACELRSRSRFSTCDRFDPMHGRLPALLRVPRSDAPHVKSRGAFGTFGWRVTRGSLQGVLLPPASVGFSGSC